MPRPKSSKALSACTATIGFESKLWLAADSRRAAETAEGNRTNNMDEAEPSGVRQPARQGSPKRQRGGAEQYKHVVLDLIFLKYISDTFEVNPAKLLAGEGDYAGANPEEPDEYKAEKVFRVPADARWSHLQASAKQITLGKTVDDDMVAIERDNPRLKGVPPKDYARPGLDKHRLRELIDLIGSIQHADVASHSKDLLRRVLECFLTEFDSAEGKNAGQIYTPSCVLRLLFEMLAPYKGRIYGLARGSGGMFVQSEKFVESHGGQLGDISIYGQESNPTRRRLAAMNLALHGIEANSGSGKDDTVRRPLHRELGADCVFANPPFNDSNSALRGSAFLQSGAKPQLVSEAKANFRKDDDVRWGWRGPTRTNIGSPQGSRGGANQFGVPPKGNDNLAWVQHFIHHLAPHGMAGFVLANGSMSSDQSGDCHARSAHRTWAINWEGLGRQRDIHATFPHHFCLASYASVAA